MTRLYFVRLKPNGKNMGKTNEFDSKDEAFDFAKEKIDSDDNYGVQIIIQDV